MRINRGVGVVRGNTGGGGCHCHVLKGGFGTGTQALFQLIILCPVLCSTYTYINFFVVVFIFLTSNGFDSSR